MQQEDARVKLNIGGIIFVTTKDTLMKEDTIFKTVLSTSLPVDKDEQGALKFDRLWTHFPVILGYLRTGELKNIGIRENDLEQLQELLEEVIVSTLILTLVIE